MTYSYGDYFGGGITVRDTVLTLLDSLNANYIEGQNFAIETQEFCSVYNLIGLSGTIDGQTIICGSYYNSLAYLPGNSGGGVFVWDSTKAKSSHNGITVISPTVPWAGNQATLSAFHAGTGETDPTGLGCWVRDYEGQLTVFAAGAIGNGSVDDTVAIQGAVNVVGTAGGGTVFLPAATYRISSTITISAARVRIEGEGMFNTIITRSADFGDMIKFTGNDATGALLRDCGISKIKLRTTGLTTSGAGLKANGVLFFDVSQIYIENGFIGFHFTGAGQCFVDNIACIINNIYGGTSAGRRYMQFNDAPTTYAHPSSGGIFITNFQLRGISPLVALQNTVEYGLNIESADGIWLSNGHVGNAEMANYRLYKVSSRELSLVYLNSCMSDEGMGAGVYMDTAVGRITDVKFVNFTAKGAAVATIGLDIAPTCDTFNVNFSNSTFTEFLYQGVNIQSSLYRKASFVNCHVNGNSHAGNNLYPGYELANNVNSIEIIGGSSGWQHVTPGDPGTQNYGIKFGGTGHSNINIVGVDLTKNLTASWNGTALPSGVNMVNCPNTFLSANHTQDMQVQGKLGMGTVPGASNVLFNKDISGSTTYYNQINRGTVKSDVTVLAAGCYNALNTEAAAFTLSNYTSFLAGQETIGAGSAVTNLIGFNASSNLTGGSSNFGFRSDIASGNGRFNFYAQGTARNFMAGRLDVGGTARTITNIAPSLTNPISFYSSNAAHTNGVTAASGTIAHVAVNSFDNPDLLATNASVTYTNASTVYIDGAPTASTNITITNPYSLYVSAGNSHFGGLVNTTESFTVDGVQVVSNRVTGWTADTGTAKRTANTTYSATASVAYDQTEIQTLMDMVRDQSQTIKALKDDLIAHGLIGS